MELTAFVAVAVFLAWWVGRPAGIAAACLLPVNGDAFVLPDGYAWG